MDVLTSVLRKSWQYLVVCTGLLVLNPVCRAWCQRADVDDVQHMRLL